MTYVMQHRWEQKDQTFWDCSACRSRLPTAERARFGCAYVPGATGARGVPGARLNNDDCPGYSIGLPVVQEVASCHAHWDRGHLREKLAHNEPTPLLMGLLELYDGARRGAESYFMQPEDKR